MVHKYVVGALLAGVAVTGSSLPQSAEAGSRPACHGKAATILGTPGKDQIKGTAGPDVIVGLGGDDDISASGGNDTICAGAGDDLVVTGKGKDYVSGGPGDDNLNNDFAGSNGADAMFGGVGDDLFFGGPDGGTVRGGDGKDAVAFFQAAPGFVVDGGAGRDQIYLAAPDGAGTIVVDAAAGTFAVDGGPADGYISWEKATFIGQTVGSWTYQGTDDAEIVRLFSDSGLLSAHLAGGDDSVQVGVDTAEGSPFVHHLDGGDGADTAIIDDYAIAGQLTPQDCTSIETVTGTGVCGP